MCDVLQEEQVRKVRAGNQERFQQLESAIQDKLQQAAERRLLLEAEQKEKLRSYVRIHRAYNRMTAETVRFRNTALTVLL